MSAPTDELGLDHADVVALLSRQTSTLEQIAAGAPLGGVLCGITTTLEELLPGCRCSVLLLDPAAATLRHGAAPSLPPDYSHGIDGLSIGTDAGACGTAAYLGTAVVSEDIRTDPRWARYRPLAERFGLRSCWSTPIRGRDGISGTFAVYHDRPHRPSAREERLVERLSHLASVAIDHDRLFGALTESKEAELARRAAESANRAKTDFLTALGHELRTPLQAISGFTELLGTLDLDTARRSAALEHIASAGKHILSMVDDVLDVARIEAGALPLCPGPVEVAEIVAEVLAMLEPLAGAERVALRSAPHRGPVQALADERRLRQVLLNLVANAIRYNRRAGEVVVGWTATASRVTVSVRDTGPGIAPEHLDRLFTPFDRLGAVSDEGVGLGLPLARGLTETMQGRLEVRSVVGEGTAVTVELPRAERP